MMPLSTSSCLDQLSMSATSPLCLRFFIIQMSLVLGPNTAGGPCLHLQHVQDRKKNHCCIKNDSETFYHENHWSRFPDGQPFFYNMDSWSSKGGGKKVEAITSTWKFNLFSNFRGISIKWARVGSFGCLRRFGMSSQSKTEKRLKKPLVARPKEPKEP